MLFDKRDAGARLVQRAPESIYSRECAAALRGSGGKGGALFRDPDDSQKDLGTVGCPVRGLLVAIALVAPLPVLGGSTTTLTYYENIKPLLDQRCAGCHRAGEIGPMPLTSYREVRPWAKAIKEAVVLRNMPPWSADSSVGLRFRNDRSLPAEEIRQISSWVDAGAAEGTPVAESAAAASSSSDEIGGKPDLVIQIPQFAVPASGTMQYTFLVTALNFKEDKWVAGAEWKIDHPEVVHHMNAFVRPPGSSYIATAPYGQPYVASKAERLARRPDEVESDRRELLIGYEPGYRAAPWGADRAKLIKKGSDMVFEMHYTANGKAVVDSSELRIYFAHEAPKHRVLSLQPSDRNLAIPAGDANYRSIASATFNSPVTLISMQPHMHLRGKAYEMTATYPDGRRETLIRVPRYDFHWQTTYFLAEPVTLPKGTVVECTAWYDNSPNNRNNPDPSKIIYWGDQSWDEMNVGFLEVAFDAAQSPEVAVLSTNSTPPPAISELRK
jgi:hypothetical protein